MGNEKSKSQQEEQTTTQVQAPQTSQTTDFGSNTAQNTQVRATTDPVTADSVGPQNDVTADSVGPQSGPKGQQDPAAAVPDPAATPAPAPTQRAPKPEEVASADVQRVVDNMAQAIADNPTKKNEILASSATQMAAVFGQLSPDQLKSVMETGGQQALDAITGRAGQMTPEQKAKLVESLAATGESLGREHVGKLADSIYKNMGGMEGLTDRGMLDGIENGMRSGTGSLLGAALVNQGVASGGKTAEKLMTRMGDTAGAIGNDFQKAQQEAAEKNYHLEKWKQNAIAMGMAPEHIAAGEAQFRGEHKAVYEAQSKAADTFASNLEGQGYALDTWKDITYQKNGKSILTKDVDNPDSLFHDQDIGDAFRTNLYTATTLAQSDTGREHLGHKVLQSGQGRRTWLDTAQDHRTSFVARAKKEADGSRHVSYSDQLEQAVFAGGDKAVTTMSATGDVGGVNTAIAGMANQTRYTDPVLADAMLSAGEDYAKYADEFKNGTGKGSDFVKGLGGVFSKTASSKRFEGNDALNSRRRAKLERLGGAVTIGAAGISMLDGVSAQDALNMGSGASGMYHSIANDGADLMSGGKLTRAGKLGMLGPGLGAAAEAANILSGNVDARNFVSLGLASFETYAAYKGAIEGTKHLGKLAGKLSLITTVAFSSWDTYKALDRGDYIGATAAAAPLIGAGIGVGVGVAGGATVGAALTGPAAPIGAAIGAVVGLGIAGVQWMMTPSQAEKMEGDTWGATAAMMQSITGDTWEKSVATAKRMRNVDGDLRGAGPQIGDMAKKMGVDPHVLLTHIHQQPNDIQDWFFDRAEDISTNSDQIRKQSEAYAKMKFDDPRKIPQLTIDNGEASSMATELKKFGFGTGSAPTNLDRNAWIYRGDHIHQE